MNPFSGMLTKVLAVLVAAVGILGGLFVYGRSKKAEGRADADHEQLEGAMDAVKDKADLDRELGDTDARKRLREKHFRD